MHPVSFINTHHDVTDLVNRGMVKFKKRNIKKTPEHCSVFVVNFEHISLLFLRQYVFQSNTSQLAFTCSKLIIERLEQGMKYVQS